MRTFCSSDESDGGRRMGVKLQRRRFSARKSGQEEREDTLRVRTVRAFFRLFDF